MSYNYNIENNVISEFDLIEFNSTKNNTSINYSCSFNYLLPHILINFIIKYEFYNIKVIPNSSNIFKLISSLIPTNLSYNNMFQPNKTNIQLISGQKIIPGQKIYRKNLENIYYDRNNKKFKKIINNMEYVIVYKNDLFMEAFSSVILNTPIMNSNNKISYTIINSSSESKYEYIELFENDITKDYIPDNCGIYYDPINDDICMRHISNSHKFSILYINDSVVMELEYITCQFKQVIPS